MEKQQIGRAWLGVVLVTNVLFLGYLYAYQEPAGFVFGVPEALVVFFVLMAVVGAVNSTMGWLYLGKPDLTEVFAPRPSDGTVDRTVSEDD